MIPADNRKVKFRRADAVSSEPVPYVWLKDHGLTDPRRSNNHLRDWIDWALG